MTTQTVTCVTPEEYLAAERLSETRSEYLDGGVHPMTGGTVSRNRITINLILELGTQLRSADCHVHATDLKVGLPDSRKFFYPDVLVVCGDLRFYDERKDIITNPELVIEVLSPSTEAFDRGAKFEAYRTIESLKEYILISQERPLVEQFVRNDDGRWTYQPAGVLGSSLTLPSIECTLSLNAVYDKVDFNS